jgi:Domain of unknown function (DUF5615)
MRLLVDAMLPPQVADLLKQHGHDSVTPVALGAHNLPDDVLIEAATAERRVIVTENASDFAEVATCPVVLVLKSWWPSEVLAVRLAEALERWAEANPDAGPWAHWLEAEFR